MSSIGNLGLTVLVAASTDVRTFARFALIYAAYAFLLGAQRAFISEPLILRIAGKDEATGEIRKSVAVCVLADLLVAAGFVLTWSFTRSPEVLWAAAAVSVALFQDALRFCNIAREHYAPILASDTIWLAIIGVGAFFRSHLAAGSASPWLILWGGGAAVGALVLLKRDRPVFTGCIRWLRGEIKLSGAFLVDHLIASGLAQVLLFLLPAVSSLSVVAAVKVGQTAGSSVLAVVTLAIGFSSLPAMTRAFTTGGYRPAMQVTVKSTVVITAAGLVWTAFLLVIPDSLGATFFGASWAKGGHLAPIFAVQAIAAGFWLQGIYLMRVTGNAGRSVMLRTVLSPLMVGATIGLAKVYGGEGFAWGSAGSTALAAVVWWWTLRRIAGNLDDQTQAADARPHLPSAVPQAAAEQGAERQPRRPSPYAGQHRTVPPARRPSPHARNHMAPTPAPEESGRPR